MTKVTKQQIENIAERQSEAMLELLYHAIDWELSDIEADGDDYMEIHSETMTKTIHYLLNTLEA